MTLKSLVAMCIKYYLQDDETGFNEMSIDNYIQDPNYKSALNNIIGAINRSINRLFTLHKLPFKHVDFEIADNSQVSEVCLSELKVGKGTDEHNLIDMDKLGEIIFFVGKGNNGSTIPVQVQRIDYDTFEISSSYTNIIRLFYRERIPTLVYDPFSSTSKSDDRDFELTSIGVTDAICQYIVYQVKGELLEMENDNNAFNYKNVFEQFLAEMPDLSPSISQQRERYNVFKEYF